MHQTTIKQTFTCSGTGLHSGEQVSLRVQPAPVGSGIVFAIHTPNGVVHIAPRPDAVIATGMATTLGAEGGKVSTVEHLLAAVRGLSIDNLLLTVEGGEIPILDGSAAEWVRLFSQAGVENQPALRKVLRLVRPVELHDGDKSIRAYPHNGFLLDYTIEFPHPAIGRQQLRLEVTPETFPQIARARTFGFYKEVEYLWANGLARGGSLDNAVVVGDDGVINPGGLRFDNEFVRHKALDFVGDMAMLPLPLQGHFEVSKSGHELNNKFARKLVEEKALREVTLRPSRRAVTCERIRSGVLVPA